MADATPTNKGSKSAAAREVSPEVLEQWNRDIGIINESLALMLANELAAAEQKLDEAVKEVEQRSINFKAGEHDLRGCFAFVRALISLINGLAAMEENQLQLVLERVWAADELCVLDGDWAGRTVLRGLCLLVAGLVEVMQGSATRGIWHILRSWLWLRSLESEALTFEGHERNCVRSTALLALGAFNLLVSMLPPQAMRTATWITGFKGGRETALDQLRTCWKEGGIQAPFAALVLVGFSADVCTFLGELKELRMARCEEVRMILDWAAKDHPNSFFFRGLEASYFAAVQDLDKAVESLTATEAIVKDLPAFLFVVHLKNSTMKLAQFAWADAAIAFRAALEVHRQVGRRAFCPTLAMNAHLCHLAAGQPEEAADALQIARSYRAEKKKWSIVDKMSLDQADLAYARSPEGAAEAEGGRQNPKPGADEKWEPMLVLYMKVCVIHRSACFMTADQVKEFISKIEAEMALQKDDADTQCCALALQAEALRQAEHWDDALAVCARGLDLQSTITERSLKLSAIHFFHLVRAFAQYAKGKTVQAKAELQKLQSVYGNNNHLFKRNIEFKATYLAELLGAEMKEDPGNELVVTVQARKIAEVVIEVPEGVEEVEYDWTLADMTIDFDAVFQPATSSASTRSTTSDEGSPKDSSPAGSDDQGVKELNLHHVEQRSSAEGPFCGEFQPKSAGVLKLTFGNTFSMLRSKSVTVHVRPQHLVMARPD